MLGKNSKNVYFSVMSPWPLALILLCLISSCATIMNQPQSATVVHADKPTRLLVNGDTIDMTNRTYKLQLERSKKDVQLTVLDSPRTTITLPAHNSFAWYANIFCNYGIGMLIEKNDPKRYTYPAHVYLNNPDTAKRFVATRPIPQKGRLELHVSLPHINTFSFQPVGESRQASAGFWGFSLGVNYYHRKNQFLQFAASALADVEIPFWAHIDYSGEVEFMNSQSLSLTNNHYLKRFTIGYGLSFARNRWGVAYHDRFDPPPPTRDPVTKHHYSLGLLASGYCNLGKSFSVGLIYRPGLYRVSQPAQFVYEHAISVDLAWKIVLKR